MCVATTVCLKLNALEARAYFVRCLVLATAMPRVENLQYTCLPSDTPTGTTLQAALDTTFNHLLAY